MHSKAYAPSGQAALRMAGEGVTGATLPRVFSSFLVGRRAIFRLRFARWAFHAWQQV